MSKFAGCYTYWYGVYIDLGQPAGGGILYPVHIKSITFVVINGQYVYGITGQLCYHANLAMYVSIHYTHLILSYKCNASLKSFIYMHYKNTNIKPQSNLANPNTKGAALCMLGLSCTHAKLAHTHDTKTL